VTITTNDYSNPVKAEPKKLGIRTSAQLPTPVPDPITRGSDPAKAITTHDLPDPPPRGRMAKLNARRAAMLKGADPEPVIPEPAPAQVEERDVEDHSKSNPLVNDGLGGAIPTFASVTFEPKKKAKPKKSA
jgi:hypothetical protein